MNERTQMYDWFARMLSYPKPEQSQDSSRFVDDLTRREVRGLSIDDSRFTSHESRVTNHESPITHYLQEFKKTVERFSVEEMEELYTRTFDINPLASLEIGWHLYGETYERGAFLVQMRGLLRQYNIEESSELPDHITHCLMVLGRMPKNEADEFAAKYLRTSLDKILEGFQGKENPYEHILLALKNFIAQEHLTGVEANA